MKTYTKTTTTTEPLLVINYDTDTDNPREYAENLGWFLTVDYRYLSPDNNEMMLNVIKRTGEKAKNVEEHMEMIKEELETESNVKVLAIYPINKYEHSGVAYSLGSKSGFDYSNNGFYIITDKTQKVLGTKKEDWEKAIISELETYNKWVNGEVYRFTLYDKNGEVEDSCGGFYDIEDIREYLPKDWEKEDLQNYLNND